MRSLAFFLTFGFVAHAFQPTLRLRLIRSNIVLNAERKPQVTRGVVEGSRTQKTALSVAAVLTAVLLTNRLLVPPELLYDSQSRSDLLAVAAIAGLVLNNIASLDVTSREADSVILEGVRGRGMAPIIIPGGRLSGAQETIMWAADFLLEETPSATIIFAWGGTVLLRQGIIPSPQSTPPSSSATSRQDATIPPIGLGPIAQMAAERADSDDPAVYMPALQTLPGRTEFTAGGVIPANTQSLLVLSVGRHGTLVLGADRARAFTPKDLDSAIAIGQLLGKIVENLDPA